MSEKKCIRIEVEYDNGDLYRALGDNAEAIRKQMDAQAVMLYVHGMEYKGPMMEKVEQEIKPA